MFLTKENAGRLTQYCAFALLIAGIGFRLLFYFQNRSLFIDEGAIASEIVGNPFSAFLAPLKYQFAPPLFSALVKVQTLIFGSNEYALRLIPLFAGLGSLFLFYSILKKHFIGLAYLFPLAVFALALPFLHYATECKQYSTDVLSTILLLTVFYKYRTAALKKSEILTGGLLGALLIWFSMPVVFILFGIGIYLLVDRIVDGKNWMDIAGMILIWLLSFGIYFFKILVQDIGLDSLSAYHNEYFFPLIPSSIEELKIAGTLLISFLTTMLRGTVIAQMLGLLLFSFGIIQFWKVDRKILLVLLLPLLATILASGLGYYSLLSRLILFSMPLILIVLAGGIQLIIQKTTIYLQGVLLLSMILVIGNFSCFDYIFQRFEIDEVRPVLEYVHTQQNSEGNIRPSVYIHHTGITAYNFYQYHHDDKGKYQLQQVTEGDWRDDLTALVAKQAYPCWVVLNHLTAPEQEEVLNLFRKDHKQVNSFKKKNAGAWLFQ